MPSQLVRKSPSRRNIDELRRHYEARKTEIVRRLEDFHSVPPSKYFYELVYCLLTPQSSAVNAAKAVELLKSHEFHVRDVDAAPLLHQKDFYVRFHHTKGKHLRAAKAQFPLVTQHLSNGSSDRELRDWLVENVMGFGYKEASHFLRNIGRRNLAILDRHILKNLVRHRIIRSLPKTMTPKSYFAIEKKFAAFADRLGISMDELDLLFWSMETGEILK